VLQYLLGRVVVGLVAYVRYRLGMDCDTILIDNHDGAHREAAERAGDHGQSAVVPELRIAEVRGSREIPRRRAGPAIVASY
jgi:hypothetical protein